MKARYPVIFLLMSAILSLGIGCSKNVEHDTLNNTPVPVKVHKVEPFNNNHIFEYSGTIRESESIPLSFSVVGNVSQVYVTEGTAVKKGTLLAELNNETFKNAYEMSLATFKQAEDAYDRLLPMYNNGNLPEIKLIEIETSLQQSKAAAAISKKSLDDCYLYSPVDGIVGRRSIDIGMGAMPGLTAIEIIKIDKVFAQVSVSENEIASIKAGQNATVKVTALGNMSFSGAVEEIGVVANPLSHTYNVKICINNKGLNLKPGMICNVVIESENAITGLLAPNQAVLVDEKGQNFVYCVDPEQKRATQKYVETGRLLKDGIEITNGLKQGDLVVIAGQQKLFDNILVSLVN